MAPAGSRARQTPASLSSRCLILLALIGPCVVLGAFDDEIYTGRRMLVDAGGQAAAAARREALEKSGGQAGPYTDFVIVCEGFRARCPSLFLASWGFQCSTRSGSKCCLTGDGRHCVELRDWQQPAPAGWRGMDLTVADPAGVGAALGAPPANTTVATPAGTTPAGIASNGSAASDTAPPPQQDDEQGPAGPPPAPLKRSPQPPSKRPPPPRKRSASGSPKSSQSPSRWQRASATYYNSYPECCSSKRADQTECWHYSGCEWQGLFAAFNDRKSKSWVAANNLAAVFQVGQSRGEWERRWKNAKLLIRNPRTGKTMEVQVADTCSDSDCSGCCTRNARRSGGTLVDLEFHTARRFWGSSVPGVATLEWQRA
ncbi:hypothetical protein C2E20_2301 [Micractinium conductrix]|uniref:Uncharacterized protein n=1 Tax=Micractinium conductrix TaxID=554055 RepID=A0A2P6VKV3_9CHLO|nr:hypothetical protein C2E20_2301 [Micractinium conductrix]|eukprot:PSC74732.1 hypothetical protein C2E20_2301 [Micractinium conductrix]